LGQGTQHPFSNKFSLSSQQYPGGQSALPLFGLHSLHELLLLLFLGGGVGGVGVTPVIVGGVGPGGGGGGGGGKSTCTHPQGSKGLTSPPGPIFGRHCSVGSGHEPEQSKLSSQVRLVVLLDVVVLELVS
jgi:hypothetical protein